MGIPEAFYRKYLPILLLCSTELLGAAKTTNATWTRIEINGRNQTMGEFLEKMEFLRTQVVLGKPTIKQGKGNKFLGIFLHTTEVLCDNKKTQHSDTKVCEFSEVAYLQTSKCEKTNSTLRVWQTWKLCYDEEQVLPKTLRLKTTYDL